MNILEKQFFENNSPLVVADIDDCIALSQDGYIVKTIYIEDNLTLSTLIDIIENQIELAKQYRYILQIKEYCFQMLNFPQICYIKYDCQGTAQSLSKIFKNLVQYSDDFKRRLFEQLKIMYEYMESKNICHKNLKPCNIIYWENEFWLTDFENLKTEICNEGLKLNFSQKLDCYPYLCDKFFDIFTSADYFDKIKKLTPQDYQQQNEYAISMMRFRLISNPRFEQNQDTYLYWQQNINNWKNWLCKNIKLDNEQKLMHLIKAFQKIFQTQSMIIFQSGIPNQIEPPIQNQEIKLGEQFLYYYDQLKANEQSNYENKIIKVEPKSILISPRTIFLQGIEIIRNSIENPEIVVHYKNIRQGPDTLLNGDNCEIIWQLLNKVTKRFEVKQKYVGQYRNSKRNGTGQITKYQTDLIISYDGEWVNDLKQGRGVQTERCLRTNIILYLYEGFFENNLYHGQGTLTITSNNETSTQEGVHIYHKQLQNGRKESKRITYKKYCCFGYYRYEEPM